MNTSSVSGTTGTLDFQFNPGNTLTSQPASVQILDFTGATYLAGSQQDAGGASGGPLPATIDLSNSTSFNDDFEGVDFGSSVFFVLDFGGPAVNSPNGTSTSQSQFTFSLFSDSNGTVPLFSGDPGGVGGAVTVNLNGSLTTVANQNLQFAQVPEPSSLWLWGSGLILLGCVRMIKR